MLEQLEKATSPKSKSIVDESISRKDPELAWLAGFIDGEGCLSAYIDKQSMRLKNGGNKVLDLKVKVTNTHMPTIKKISEIYKKHGIGFYYATNSVRFSALEINVDGMGRIKKLLTLLLPYLETKLYQAELMIELVNYRQSLGFGRKSENILENKKIEEIVETIKSEKKIRWNPIGLKRQANEVLGIPRDFTFPIQKDEDKVQPLQKCKV